MAKKKIITAKLIEIQKEFKKTNDQMAVIFNCSLPMYGFYKRGEKEIPDYRWDRFEAEFKIRREWVLTNKGPRNVKTQNDILMELGEDAKLLSNLKNLKLSRRLSLLPPNIARKKLKLLHDFLDFYIESLEKVE
ncbi:hypothetical protein [Leptospira kmetyi]|uniref:Transcriptional regulator n=1 Tax=Leptospira kmetyi TaxID=408139 RepID=A0ABX4N5Z0_9LEPT|nr:hypothetical protein [Leptospira kmetyi]PJZ28721.1 hypothetical protein CH378_16090 [Leptospira kmetyi]PJZ39507.1 hypothetical protein CH370_20845 [Leptospira kmetyi]